MELGIEVPVTSRADRKTEPDVRRAVAGDTDAFERLYRRHLPRVYSLARRLLGSEEEAEDATQEIFLRAWERLPGFGGHAAFSTWLHRLARNTSLNRLASRGALKRSVELADTDVEQGLDPRAAAPEAGLDLESALDGLPDRARAVVVLHDVEGFTHAEIADELGITEGTSKSQLHRARALLRIALSRSERTRP